jgi:hypothetical protein
MGHLILQGANTDYPGFSLFGESTLGITFDETGTAGDINKLDFLVLSGTTSVSLVSNGVAGPFNEFHQLEEKDNVLTRRLSAVPRSLFSVGLLAR